ncbi:hypothetical protein GCM10028820_20830 [Tessaracoccus terricola]
MNPEEFSEAIDDALPPPPATKGWGAMARRRSRNRRAAAVTGVVGAVAVAVVAVSSQLSGQPTMTATPAPADSSPQGPTPLVPEICQGILEEPYQELPDDGRMPEGAEQVWICGGKGLGQWGDVNLVAVAEPLTMDVEEAVAVFNAEPTATMAIDCDGVQSEMFDVVYAYPDGTRYVAQTHVGRTPDVGCNHVSVGGWLRFEPQAFVADLAELWEQQRAAQGAAFVPGDDVCPDGASVFDVSPKDAASGFVCLLTDDGTGEAVQIRLSDGLVADIAAEIEVTGDGPEPGLERSAPSLVLQNEHGDPFTIFGTPEGGYHWYPPRDAGGMQTWIPSTEIRDRMLAEIDAGLAEEPVGPADSPSPTTPVVATTTSGEPAESPTRPEPDPAATGSPDSYTEQELQFALRALLNNLNGEDPGAFIVVVSRATFRDAWNIASSDVVLGEYPLPDDAPVLVVRISGPVEGSFNRFDNTTSPGAGLLLLIDAATGAGVGGGAHYLFDDEGNPGGPPPVDTSIESDVIDLEVPDTTGERPLDLQGRAARECHSIMTDTDTWSPAPTDGSLPEGAESVWLCLGFLSFQTLGVPWTGYGVLTGSADLTAAAVQQYNSLPATGDPCPGGWGGYVVYDYPDGSRYVVAIRDKSQFEPGGCLGVNLGEHERTGAEGYVTELRQLWEEAIDA